MKISVVILSFNSANYIKRCLESVRSALNEMLIEYEVFVVNNGSSDHSLNIIKQQKTLFDERLKLIELSQNTGTTYSRNQALKQASGDYVLILDSDAYINKVGIETLLDYLKQETTVGMAVPRITYASGHFQLSCDQFPTLLNKLRRFFFLKSMEAKNQLLAHVTEPMDVDYAISACWLLKSTAMKQVGLFDERIFYSPEDVDYCIRIWSAGYKITYVPKATVIHDAQELSRGFRLTRFHFSHLKGLLYLMRKHRYFWNLNGLYTRLKRFS